MNDYDLREIVHQTKARRRHGKYDSEQCPFHADSKPSLLIWQHYWKCQAGCGKGDGIDFLARYHNVSRGEARKLLGIPVPARERLPEPPKAPVEDLPQSLGLQYHLSLQPREREYFHWRGLTDETIDRFELGYGVHPGGGYPRFTLPIYNGKLLNVKFRSDDRCVTCFSPNTKEVVKDERIWQCSDCDDVYYHPDKITAKYLNIKSHGELRLFGAELLEAEHQRAFICEGEFDAMMLRQNGYTAVSGTAGCGAFSASFAVLFLHVPRVYACYDSDPPGQKGAKSIVELIPKTRVVNLPTKDVSQFFLQNTKQEFEELLKAADRNPMNCLGLRLGNIEWNNHVR